MLRIFAKLLGLKHGDKRRRPLSERARRELEARIGYQFKKEEYLAEALTHRSYLNNSSSTETHAYERLEFLGDSVLGLIVAEELFHRYPQMTEGELTKSRALLVNQKVLAYTGGKVGLGDYVLLSGDEVRTGGRSRQSIIADCLEALIGAVYCDGGADAARVVITRLISFDFDKTSEVLSLRNYKGELLELLQAQGLGSPKYTVIREDGPEHRKKFTVDVLVTGKRYGIGSGDSKKSAEQKAAKNALIALEHDDNSGIDEVEKI